MRRSLDSPVWDLGTTMSKLLAVGMPFEAVVEAVTRAPMAVIGLADAKTCSPPARRPSSLSSMTESADLRLRDSMGAESASRAAASCRAGPSSAREAVPRAATRRDAARS